MIKKLIKDFVQTTSLSSLEEDLCNLLLFDGKIRWEIFRDVEKELHKEDIFNEFDSSDNINNEDVERILERYEDNLSNSEDWHYCLKEAMEYVKCG
jgi:hypothetical protein